jgi:hypothetical protein
MMKSFVVEAYYKGKLIMCLPDVQAEKYGDALKIGKEKMSELKPRMKNHGFNIKQLK